MRDHDGDVRGFYWLSQAYYAKSAMNSKYLDEITIGLYAPDGGTSGEFNITWEMLEGKWIPKLGAFDDSWSALVRFSDLLEALVELDSTSPSPDDIAGLLMSLGIEDMTPHERPC